MCISVGETGRSPLFVTSISTPVFSPYRSGRLAPVTSTSIVGDHDCSPTTPLSSDAATVLMALDKLLDLNLDQKKLSRLALELGADVPFFLGSSPAWAEGVGEVLTPLEHELPECCFVLANPGIALSTAQVYRRVERYTLCPVRDGIITNFEELVAVLHNDLESPALELAPQVKRLKAGLLENGAHGALMSGSGSTVFGVFDSKAIQKLAVQQQTRTYGCWTCVATGVS